MNRGAIAWVFAVLCLACSGCRDASDAGGAGSSGAGSGARAPGDIINLLDSGFAGGGDDAPDAGELGDSQVPVGNGTDGSAGSGGDGDAQTAADASDDASPGCADEDNDSVCDSDDTCPVGAEALCDTSLWTVELPNGEHVASDAESNGGSWMYALQLQDQPQSAIEPIRFELAPPETFTFEMNIEQTEQVRDFLAMHTSVSARVLMTTPFGSVFEPIQGPTKYCPFDPHAAVVRRVLVSGTMSDTGVGSIRFELRGYVDPS